MGNFIWLKSCGFVFFSDVVGSGNLVGNGLGVNIGDLLGNLVLLSHVFGDSVGMGIIG